MFMIQKKNNKKYWFIITLLSFEILLTLLFSFSDIGGFSLTPYIRLGLIAFTVLFFATDILKITIPLTINFTKIPYVNLFVYGWVLFAGLSILIGLFNKNPPLYIITDFIYTFLGALLFYVTTKNKKITENNATFYIKLSRVLCFIAVCCIIFNLKAPALLLVLMVVLLYLNLLKNRFLDVLLLVIPYCALVISSNRSQLIVFLLMIFILFLKNFRYFFTKKSVLAIGIGAISIIVLLKEQLLNFALLFVDKKSNIGFRINQLSIIFKEGIDYSNPFFVSISQRIVEAEIVMNYWTQNILSFVFGMGSGATIDGSSVFSDGSVLNSALLGSGKIHNIHLLPFSLIFRYGFIGLLLFILITYIVYQSFIKVLNESSDSSIIFWNLFLILWFFFSVPAASFLWSMPVFWISLSMITKKNI